MKKCPFCAEEILDEAKKCKHCGEFLDGRETVQQPVVANIPDGGMTGGKLFGIIVAAIVVGTLILIIG